MSKRTYTRPYVGLLPSGKRETFRSVSIPTETSHGHIYRAAIGPFRTMRAAKYMVDSGQNNPHTQTVTECERLAQPNPISESSMINSIETYTDTGRKAGKARRNRDESLVGELNRWLTRALALETSEDKIIARAAFNAAYSEEATPDRRPF